MFIGYRNIWIRMQASTPYVHILFALFTQLDTSITRENTLWSPSLKFNFHFRVYIYMLVQFSEKIEKHCHRSGVSFGCNLRLGFENLFTFRRISSTADGPSKISGDINILLYWPCLSISFSTLPVFELAPAHLAWASATMDSKQIECLEAYGQLSSKVTDVCVKAVSDWKKRPPCK